MLLVIAGHVVTWVFAVVNGVDAELVVPWAFASIVLAVVESVVLLAPLRLTDAGAQKRDYLHGVRDYLELAEAERIRMLQSPAGADKFDVTDRGAVVKLHERLLPFAVLFGIEREWAAQLEVEYGVTGERPAWLSSTSSSLNLGRAVSGFSAGASSRVRPPAPESSSSGSSYSSSSGGSSGGGSSGGGSGGGGGGGR
jgi:uncharacterized membrane protein YgcG